MYNVVDLFSGVGGLSYGFAKSPDFNILMANEIDKKAATAYSLNHPTIPMLNCDIKEITEEKLQEVLKGQKVDLIIGGPPCQSYSTIGQRKLDNKAYLFLEYKRMLEILRPSAFIFENVTGILSMDKGKLFPKILKEFEDIGYELKYKVLDAANYGVPQHRKRVILVGFNGNNVFEYPEPTHGEGKKPYVTFGDAVGDLPVTKNNEEKDYYEKEPYNEFLQLMRNGSGEELTEQRAPNSSEQSVKWMEKLKDGETVWDLPEGFRPPHIYGCAPAKFWWNKPATTITRGFNACRRGTRSVHPRDSRPLTIREAARLQSFPDNYLFYGNKESKSIQIGNTVPPLLSVALCSSIKMALDKKGEVNGK